MAKKTATAAKKTATAKGAARSKAGAHAGAKTRRRHDGDEERAVVQPTTTSRAAHETARAERAADPELLELDDEAIDRLDDPRDTDDEIAAARAALDAPDGADAQRALDDEASPVLAGGDVDAAATETGSGEEAVGGSNPTPDQDSVEEQGEALGVTYQPGEPLHTTEKIARRDDDRWELNPSSSEDFAERRNLQHALPERPRRRTR